MHQRTSLGNGGVMNQKFQRLSLALMICCVALTFTQPASAEHRRGHAVGWGGGHWHHGYYGGRLGWWWVVGPSWYYYDAPVYPYRYDYPPSEVVVVQQPAPSGPPPAQTWYRCDDPSGYYPYVSNCPNGWTQVPVTPSPPPATESRTTR